MNQSSFVIVIGASAGGLGALTKLVAQLSRDINTSIFVVLHLSGGSSHDYLCKRIQRSSSLPCSVAKDGEPVKAGHLYISPPNYHLIVKRDMVKLGNGPVENRWRPSIDVLFRSAAVAYRERVIGIILSGLLDDGTSGMKAIRNCGGTCIVQEPNEAEYPDMPNSVLNNLEVDYRLPLRQMGPVISDLISRQSLDAVTVPEQLVLEAEIAEKNASGIEKASALGASSPYSCPDCGGSLWEIDEDGFKRYRCHIGHAYSESDLLKKQSEQTESTLWVALRMMEERRNLLNRIGNEEVDKGLNTLASSHIERAMELEGHINVLKQLLYSSRAT